MQNNLKPARKNRDWQKRRPVNEAPAAGPYWIVLNLSQHRTPIGRPKFPFRHASEEAAMTEARRLAALPNRVGWRFGVFAFCGSAKVESGSIPAEVEQEAA